MIAVVIFKMLRTRKIVQKLDFWSLVKPKICLGPALRATFRISAQLALTFVIICICNTYLNKACRDGLLKLVCKAILLYGGGRQTG